MLAVVLGAAVAGKLRSPAGLHGLVRALGDIDLIPHKLSMPAAVGLVGLEAIGAVLLVIPSAGPVGLLVAAAVMILLTFGVSAIVLTRRSVLCNCFGAGGSIIGLRHIVRNALLSLLAVAAVGADDISHAWTGDGGPALLAVVAGVALGACIVAWDDVAFVLVGSPA